MSSRSMTPESSGQPFTKKQSISKKRRFRLFFLHRYAGLIAAFFTLILAVSGIMLNHTEELGLHDKRVYTPWLMHVYGIKTPKISRSYAVTLQGKKNWVVERGNTLFLGNQPLPCQPPLKGALGKDELLLLINNRQLCLLTSEAELVDVLVPVQQGVHLSGTSQQTISKIGLATGNVVYIETGLNQQTHLYRVNADFTQLISTDSENNVSADIQWKASKRLPDNVREKLLSQYRGEGLPLERIILDLHSGRLIGMAGVFWMDLIGLLLIFLAVTGVWMWLRKGFKKSVANIQIKERKKAKRV